MTIAVDMGRKATKTNKTFSRPLCDFLRFYMNSVSSAYFFLDFLRLFQSKK